MTAEGNTYQIIYRYYYTTFKYKYKAIYKYKRKIYKFVFQCGIDSNEEDKGIYLFTQNGWSFLENNETINYFINIKYSINSTNETIVESHANLFFEGCVKYIHFLLS